MKRDLVRVVEALRVAPDGRGVFVSKHKRRRSHKTGQDKRMAKNVIRSAVRKKPDYFLH